MAIHTAQIPLRTENQHELVFAHRPAYAFFGGLAILGFSYFIYTLDTIDASPFLYFKLFFSGTFALGGLGVVLSVFWRFSIAFNLLTRTYEIERGFLPFVKKVSGPLEDLSAVDLTTRIERGGKDESTKVVWVVSLDLKGLEKPVNVYEGYESEAYNKFEHYAKTLRVKAIDRTGMEPRETAWDELDRSVTDQEIEAPSVLPPPPAESGIVYRHAPGQAMIIMPPLGFFSVWMLGLIIFMPFALVGLAILLAAIFRPGNFGEDLVVGSAIGLLFFLVGTGALTLSLGGMAGRQVVIESLESISHALRLPGNRIIFRKNALKREIEEVSIKPIPKEKLYQRQYYEVFVRSDRKVFHIWRRKSPRELEWLRDAVLYIVRR